MVSKYVTRGYRITDAFTDNEFDSDEYCQVLLPANLHICAQGEHVLIFERSIRTIKERVRATLKGLPCTALPRIMYASLLERVERTLNNFPPPSEPYSLPPITLVEGKSQFDAKTLFLPFGSPAYVYTDSNNTMEARATLAIALCKFNESSGLFFISLQSGKRIHANKWREMPITPDIFNRVCTMDEMSYPASLDDFRIPWDEGALPADKDAADNLANTEDMIHDHTHESEMQTESVAKESDFSVVDSARFKFNMNDAYTDNNEDNNNRPTPNPVTQSVEPIDEGFDEEEDPDLDLPICDLVARERGSTLSDALSMDTSNSDGTSDTEPHQDLLEKETTSLGRL